MAYGWREEGLSSEGEPERMRFASRADSIGRTYQDDSERSSRRKANEAETGWSQPAHKLQMRPPRQRSSLREFLCRIWYLCWNLTSMWGWASRGTEAAALYFRKSKLTV